MIRRPPRSTLFPYNDALPIAHEFVVDAEVEISIRELVEGLEAGLTGRADHGADLADLGVEASDRCRVRYVHAQGRLLVTRQQNLVSSAELRGDGLTDGASSTDEEDAHDGATAPRGALFRSCCSTSRKYCRLAPVSEHTSDQTRRRAPGRHHPPWPRA